MTRRPRVLAIGGTDSVGGAGLVADVRTLASLGVHPMVAVTAVTAQDTTAVHTSWAVPAEAIRAQLRAVLDDAAPDVVKTGMLGTADAVRAVAESLRTAPLVVDPVCVASTGASLLDAGGLDALRAELLPRAHVVTPNLAEVAALTGVVVTDRADLATAAAALLALGPRWVVVTGGHLAGEPVDLVTDGQTSVELAGERTASENDHGSGCCFASALAGYLALGRSVPEAAAGAKELTGRAIAAGYPVGAGRGVINPG